MKIVIAPDSFKGSCSAKKLCSIINNGVLEVFPHASIVEFPLADGGEGTMENMVYATKGQFYKRGVCDPLGNSIEASFGVLGDNKTAVIEVAQASGLTLVDDLDKNPLLTTSYGTGELIRHALDEGFRQFIIGLGGSATNDGGMGLLKALGMKFYDENGELLSEGGGNLTKLSYIDDSQFDQRIHEADFLIASDVTNPLCGPSGASFVFGPQKGASSEMVEQLDGALGHYADVLEEKLGENVRELPGAGAAGGIGAAFLAFFKVEMQAGISVVLDKFRFEEEIMDADLIITGEGRLDSQTLHGKVIAGVSKVSKTHGVPVIALCGSKDLNHSDLAKLGVRAAFSIVPGPVPLEEALANSEKWIKEQVIQIMQVVSISSE